MNLNHNNNKDTRRDVALPAMRCCLLLLLFLAAFTGVHAQAKIVVKGIVRNEAGEAMSGATIIVQGTKILTSSKKDGTFELNDIAEGATLKISYVGYTASSIKLATGQRSLDVKLVPAANVLGDVVVNVGLYKRPVGNFTGAAKSYTGEELKTVNPVNILAALAAVEPSVRLMENNALGSDPNALPIIQLRGQNNLVLNPASTTNATAAPVSNGDFMSSYLLNPNQPLIILDGFQTTLQTIYDMDINRIARITVLKDAAATAAYGSKAANGVIVVETRQPAVGKVRVTYSFNSSFQVPDLNSYNLLDAEGLLEAQRLAGVYSDPNNNYNDVGLKQWYDRRLYQARSGMNTDWLSRPVQTGIGFNHSLNMSGGAGAVRYSLSINYNNAEGVMKGSNRSSYSINNNLSYVSKNIRFTNTTSVSYGRGNNTPWGSFSSYAKQFPFFSPYDSSGNLVKQLEPLYTDIGIGVPAPGGLGIINPEYNTLVDVEDYSYALSFMNNSSFDWSITNTLRMNASFAFSNNSPGSEQFLPADHTSFSTSLAPAFSDYGSYTQNRGQNTSLDGRISLNHYKKMGRHTILTALGFSAQQTTSTMTTVKVTGIPNEYLNQIGLANGYGANLKPVSSNNNTRSISEFLSVSYNYDERYTVEVTANASGSSQFGSNNRLAPFWAGGFGWNVDKEKFFKKNDIIQQMRIRGSIGLTGNQNFSAYLAQPIYDYNLLNNYMLQLGGNLQGYANPDLKWQQTLKSNIGVVLGLFNGKLNIGFDGYIENTDNLILPLDIAPSTGFVSYQDNLGATKNTGYELSINVPVIRDRKRNIFWTIGFNTGHYENVITKLSPAIEALNKANNSPTSGLNVQNTPRPRFVVGESMSRIWAVPSLGIDPATGKEIFVKLDGSQTFTWDPNDKIPVGESTSRFKGAISSNLTYKNFALNINLTYAYGGQLYNQTLVDKIENVDLKAGNADERVLTERWKKPGDLAYFKSLIPLAGGFQVTPTTSRFVQDDNYLTASSISLSYTLPRWNWVRRLGLTLPRLAIVQNDLFRFATIKTERGTGYPFARTFNLGFSATF